MQVAKQHFGPQKAGRARKASASVESGGAQRLTGAACYACGVLLVLLSGAIHAAEDEVYFSGFESACTWGVDTCQGGAYCRARSCAAGECTVIPASDPSKAPVCGCDGVNYWNTRTAASFGMSTASTGACLVAKTCGGFAGTPCTAGRICALAVNNGSSCSGTDLSGTCWGMPTSCGGGDAAVFRICGSLSCTSECTAMSQGTPFYSDNSCPQ